MTCAAPSPGLLLHFAVPKLRFRRNSCGKCSGRPVLVNCESYFGHYWRTWMGLA